MPWGNDALTLCTLRSTDSQTPEPSASHHAAIMVAPSSMATAEAYPSGPSASLTVRLIPDRSDSPTSSTHSSQGHTPDEELSVSHWQDIPTSPPAAPVPTEPATADLGAPATSLQDPERGESGGSTHGLRSGPLELPAAFSSQPLIDLDATSEPPGGRLQDVSPAPGPLTADTGVSSETKPAMTGADSMPALRPIGIDHEQLLRMLGEAFGHMMLRSRNDGSADRAMTDEEVEAWLQQLLRLYDSQQGSATVSALYGSLKQQHGWLRLGDVYSALLYLKSRSKRQAALQQRHK
jgi:hypothetical protein